MWPTKTFPGSYSFGICIIHRADRKWPEFIGDKQTYRHPTLLLVQLLSIILTKISERVVSVYFAASNTARHCRVFYLAAYRNPCNRVYRDVDAAEDATAKLYIRMTRPSSDRCCSRRHIVQWTRCDQDASNKASAFSAFKLVTRIIIIIIIIIIRCRLSIARRNNKRLVLRPFDRSAQLHKLATKCRLETRTKRSDRSRNDRVQSNVRKFCFRFCTAHP